MWSFSILLKLVFHKFYFWLLHELQKQFCSLHPQSCIILNKTCILYWCTFCLCLDLFVVVSSKIHPSSIPGVRISCFKLFNALDEHNLPLTALIHKQYVTVSKLLMRLPRPTTKQPVSGLLKFTTERKRWETSKFGKLL